MFTDEAEAQLAHSQRQQSTSCIICYNSLDSELIVSDDLSQTLRSNVEPSDLHRQELFKIFCDYMELDYDSFAFSYDSDPLQSTFPFCQVCEVMLMDLCELHDEMKHLVSRATQIKARLVRLVLESSNSKYIPSMPADLVSDTDSDGTEIIRKIITERYTTKVVIQSLADHINVGEKSRTLKRKPNPGAGQITIKVEQNFEDNGFDETPTCDAVSFQCPSPDNLEDWQGISSSGGSSSAQISEQQPDYPTMTSSTATTNNPAKTRSGRFVKMTKFVDTGIYSKRMEGTILESMKKPNPKSIKEVGKNYEKIGLNKYVYAGEFPFGKNGDMYRCDLCCINIPSLAKILLHMRRSHHRPRPSTKRYHKFVEVQPNKFVYGNKLAVYKVKNNFYCCSCSFKTIVKNKMVQHLREKHLTADEDGCQGEGDEDSPSIQKNLDLDSLFYPIIELNEHLNENNSCLEKEGGTKAAEKTKKSKSDSDSEVEVDDSNDSEDEMDLDQDAPQPKKKAWEEISEGKFVYRETFPFSKVGDQYFCGSPPCTNMSPTFRQIIDHVRRCHIYERTPGKARIRFTHKLVETGPGQFIYANQYPVELSDGVYTCGTCQKTSIGKYSLVEHVRTKHLNPSQDLICETCGKVYTCPQGFSRHKRSHTISQSCYKCKICGNSFARPEYLRRHMGTHMGDEVKKYVCEFCGKKFRTKVLFIGHTSTHTGEKGFHCSHCPMVFGTYNSMSYHRVRTHGKVGNS